MDVIQRAPIDVGPEVEYFARALDETLSQRPGLSRAKVFKLINAYHTYSRDRLAALKKTVKGQALRDGSSPRDDMDMDDADDEATAYQTGSDNIARWEFETQTWDLLRRILPIRYPEEPFCSSKSSPKPQTRKEYWDDFLISEPVAVERKAVLEWLQSTADSGPTIDEIIKELQESSDRGDIMAYGWIHTRSAIKKTKIVHAWPNVLDHESRAVSDVHVSSNGIPLVSQLDPDATTRQRRKLAQQDEYFEKAIWFGCFELLRRGKSANEISEWCRERTEAWRAVSMSALPLSQQEELDDGSTFNPEAIILWRRMSYALARQGGTDDYERAVYGILSGDISSVEKVCKTWDDLVFAHYNALLRTQFDNYLTKKCPSEAAASICQTFSSFNALQFHGDPHSVHESLVNSIGPASSPLSKPLVPSKALQAAIITDTFDNYIFQQGLVLAQQANAAAQGQGSKIIRDFGSNDTSIKESSFVGLGDHDALRLVAHIYIITNALDQLSRGSDDFSSLVFDSRRQVQQNVVAAYTIIMRISGLDYLVPLYSSKLDGVRVYEVLTRNLIHVVDRGQREVQLELMSKLGLDPRKFVTLQPKFLLSDIEETGQNIYDYSSCDKFSIVEPGPPNLKFGRHLALDFIGDDPEDIDSKDEWLIRSLEWLVVADGVWEETLEYGVKIYKYFLGHRKLLAARTLADRVPCLEVLANKAAIVMDEEYRDDPAWFDILEVQVSDADPLDEVTVHQNLVATAARTFWQLECLIRTLDILETVSALTQIVRE